MQISLFRGSRTVTSFRLCSRAPWTTSSSAGMSTSFYRGEPTFWCGDSAAGCGRSRTPRPAGRATFFTRRFGSTAAVAAAVVAACAALAAIALAATRRPSPEGAASEVTASFESEALASPFHFAVYLPPGYATSGKRYPVVYFLHGLPAGPT